MYAVSQFTKRKTGLNYIQSPNTVLANALVNIEDMLRPRISLQKPSKLVFMVGTQINGIPHLGTFLCHTATFLLAQRAQQVFGLPATVSFGALDNSPYKVVTHDQVKYQINFGHALDKSEMMKIIEDYYLSFHRILTKETGVSYEWSLYSELQEEPLFRKQFLNTLSFSEELGTLLSPSAGNLRVRIPCPQCSYSEKYAQLTELVSFDGSHAVFRSVCHEHGTYESVISANSPQDAYLDLNTLYRNLIKDSIAHHKEDELRIMVKGGDWVFACQLVDWALGMMSINSLQAPVRIFTPQIVTSSGSKLSKSLIREGDQGLVEVPEWILDMNAFREQDTEFVQRLIWLTKQFMSDPKHFLRSYSYDEIVRVLQNY